MTVDHNRWTIRLDGSAIPDKAVIGGKAWSIARMMALGLPVPPAFVITADACLAYLAEGRFPTGLEAEVDAGLLWIEAQTGRSFAEGPKPLLLSVRSGAAISMPGMMDTVLNLGIDDTSEAALASETGLPAFARDTHRRFLELYAAIVLKNPVELDPVKEPPSWRTQIGDVPPSPRECLMGAIKAVFESWNSRRARRYREHNAIPHNLATAVTVQAMVFGNLDEQSGTGVIFSRNPLTGERLPYGEFLPRAQGEDVVSGKFTPLALEAMQAHHAEAYSALLEATELLERENADIQDIEFTVQSGKLYLLQARSAKRAPNAAVRAAVEMVEEGMIDQATALSRVSAEQVATLLLPELADGAVGSRSPVASGEGACPGVATGIIVKDPDEADRRAAAGENIILLRATTSPDDIHGMIAARGLITEQGGSTSHAAVVSRALGRPCVVGIGANHGVTDGDIVTVDGNSGKIYAGALEVTEPDERSDPLLAKLAQWVSNRSALKVLHHDESGAITDAVDIDDQLAGGDIDMLTELLGGVENARGSVLANPKAARIAAEQGVRIIITDPVLPAMLATMDCTA
jgi:pyruvate,orthophosphate dikinase